MDPPRGDRSGRERPSGSWDWGPSEKRWPSGPRPSRCGSSPAMSIRDAQFAEAHHVAFVPLEELLRESDFVSLHTFLNDKTRHLIDDERLSLMKPTAFLINTARGGIVDTEALCRALAEKKIAGAALDVFEGEPLQRRQPPAGAGERHPEPARGRGHRRFPAALGRQRGGEPDLCAQRGTAPGDPQSGGSGALTAGEWVIADGCSGSRNSVVREGTQHSVNSTAVDRSHRALHSFRHNTDAVAMRGSRVG